MSIHIDSKKKTLILKGIHRVLRKDKLLNLGRYTENNLLKILWK